MQSILTDHNKNATGVSKKVSGSEQQDGRDSPVPLDSSSTPSWDGSLPVPAWTVRHGPCVVFVLSIVCFVNSLWGGFAFDDSEAVVNNADVRLETPAWKVFENDFWGTRLQLPSSHKSYRPLTVLTFRLNYCLVGGLYPFTFHATNVLLHGIVSTLSIAVFCRLLDGAPKASLLCSILFAVHPIHTENVAAVVGRADLLCALFFFLSLLCFAQACSQDVITQKPHVMWLWLFGCAAMGIISMLCKEPGITIFGVCFVYDVIIVCKIDISYFWTSQSKVSRTKKSVLSLIQRQTALALVACAALALRWRVMGSASPIFQKIDNPASFEDSMLLRVINYNYVYSLNAWLLVHPLWLCFDWSMGCLPVIQSLCDPRLIAVATFWALVASLLYSSLFGRDKRSSRALIMALALTVIPFLPASNLLFRVGFVIAERVLYLPSLGFSMLVIIGLSRIASVLRNRKLLQLAIMVVVLTFAARSIQRSYEWQSEEKLFRSGLKVCPLNAKVHYNIAKNAGDNGQRDLAIKEYREALKLYPDYDQAMNNLANILKDMEQLPEAKLLLERAIEIRPDFAAAWMNLGIVQSSLGLLRDAEKSYATAIRHRRKYPDCFYNLGNLYLEQKRYGDAYNAWRNATALRPTHLVSWNNLVIMLDNQGLEREAERIGLEGLAHLPYEPSLHFNLANSLGRAGHYQRSEHHFLQAINFSPSNPAYHTNLGVLYHRWKKYDRAEQSYRRALQLNPDLKSAKENLDMLLKNTRNKGQDSLEGKKKDT
ncbi:protein O-mannosyl-transferase TMTC4-like [Ornithodoros turicata]|uniref:protein O-mannosyl-transferase TMTC4-like n=1 Tax=Ornithodoros turicata TaxID=34597 RepID=UPI003139BDC5